MAERTAPTIADCRGDVEVPEGLYFGAIAEQEAVAASGTVDPLSARFGTP